MKVKERIWTYEDIDKIPEHSIIVNGREVPIMAASFVHGKWTAEVAFKMQSMYKKKYHISGGEVGILIRKEPLLVLACDVVLVSKKRLKNVPNRILEIPPDLVIEIEKEKEEIDVEEKINHYSSINILKQIWIILSRREVLVIEGNKRNVYSFDDKVEILDGKKIKFSDIEKEVLG